MKRLRFSLAQLMAGVLCFGFGFAALRNADALWASATFSLVIIAISVAITGASVRQAEARVPWVGFASASAVGLLAWLISAHSVNPFNVGPPLPLLYQLRPYINPKADAGIPLFSYTQVCYGLEALIYGAVAAALSPLIAVNGVHRQSNIK